MGCEASIPGLKIIERFFLKYATLIPTIPGHLQVSTSEVSALRQVQLSQILMRDRTERETGTTRDHVVSRTGSLARMTHTTSFSHNGSISGQRPGSVTSVNRGGNANGSPGVPRHRNRVVVEAPVVGQLGLDTSPQGGVANPNDHCVGFSDDYKEMLGSEGSRRCEEDSEYSYMELTWRDRAHDTFFNLGECMDQHEIT